MGGAAAALGRGARGHRVKSGPSWRVRPNVGSSTSTESPVCSNCGCSNASPGHVNGSAETSGSASKTACHSSQDRSWTRSIRIARRARASAGSGEVRRGGERLLLDHVLELERGGGRPGRAAGVLAEPQRDAITGARHRVDEHRHVGHAQAAARRRGPIRPGRTRSTRGSRLVDPPPMAGALPLQSAAKTPCSASIVAPCVATGTMGKAGRSPPDSTANRGWRPAARGDQPFVTRHVAQRMVRPNPVTSQCTSLRGADTRRAVDSEPVGGDRLEGDDHRVGVGDDLVPPSRPRGVVRSRARAARAPRPHRERGRARGPTPARRLDDRHLRRRVGEHHARHRGGDARPPRPPAGRRRVPLGRRVPCRSGRSQPCPSLRRTGPGRVRGDQRRRAGAGEEVAALPEAGRPAGRVPVARRAAGRGGRPPSRAPRCRYPDPQGVETFPSPRRRRAGSWPSRPVAAVAVSTDCLGTRRLRDSQRSWVCTVRARGRSRPPRRSRTRPASRTRCSRSAICIRRCCSAEVDGKPPHGDTLLPETETIEWQRPGRRDARVAVRGVPRRPASRKSRSTGTRRLTTARSGTSAKTCSTTTDGTLADDRGHVARRAGRTGRR